MSKGYYYGPDRPAPTMTEHELYSKLTDLYLLGIDDHKAYRDGDEGGMDSAIVAAAKLKDEIINAVRGALL